MEARPSLRDNPGVKPVWPALYGSGGNGEPALGSRAKGGQFTNWSGHRVSSLVRKNGLEPDSAGRLIGLIVDEQQAAFGQCRTIVLIVGHDLKGTGLHGLSDSRPRTLLRQRKDGPRPVWSA